MCGCYLALGVRLCSTCVCVCVCVCVLPGVGREAAQHVCECVLPGVGREAAQHVCECVCVCVTWRWA